MSPFEHSNKWRSKCTVSLALNNFTEKSENALSTISKAFNPVEQPLNGYHAKA